MCNRWMGPAVVLVLMIAAAGQAPATTSGDVPTVFSPQVLVLSAKGGTASVHAEIAASTVDRNSVELEVGGCSLDPYSVFADSRGELVAKLDVEDVKKCVEPGSVTVTLSGSLKEGGSFSGSDTIRVRD